MFRSSLMLLGGVLWATMLANSQTAPSTLPPRQLPKIDYRPAPEFQHNSSSRAFHIGGKQYRSTIDLEKAIAGPPWNPSSPLPISLARLEQIARTELDKLVGDESKWQVVDFQISRAAGGRHWYIAVTLEPAVQVVAESLPRDSFTALIDLYGRPGNIAQVATMILR